MKRLISILVLVISTASQAQTAPPELTIWLPDNIANFSAETLSLFGSYADTFAAENEISALIRIKKATDVGGILSTLRSASPVAPLALPAVTLLRRSDLLLASQERLIEPISSLLTESEITAFGNTRRLCEANGVLMGMPFLVDVQHLVYRPQEDVDYTRWRFEDVIERAAPLQFAGNVNIGINPTLFVQYIAAGGTFNEQGVLQYDAVALRQVLDFYELARAEEIIDEQTLQFSSPLQYTAALNETQDRQWVALASQYLRATVIDPELRFAPIPTSTGSSSTVLEGWCWVLVTQDNTLQSTAMSFISLLTTGQTAQDIARTIRLLPTQTNLLSEVVSDAEAEFYANLLNGAVLVPLDASSVAVERAIQDAFRAVINGIPAEEAVRAASAQLGG